MSRIRIEKKNIVEAGTECVVNAANGGLRQGDGVCGAIFEAAGPARLQAACDAIGHCKTGSAVITPAFELDAKYIIHAVGPRWIDGNSKEPQKLYSCYRKALDLAVEKGCYSIAFPLISSGIYGYPKEKAWRKALQACLDFEDEHQDFHMDILFTVINDQNLLMGEKELDRQIEERCLGKLNGKLLRDSIENIRAAGAVQWYGGQQPDGTFQLPHPGYPPGMWAVFEELLDPDYDYSRHYEQYCEDVLPSEMSVRQIQTMLTYMYRNEAFCDGFIQKYLDDGTLLKLLLRLDDLLIRYYSRRGLPVGERYRNPVFWFEEDKDGTPVLVKVNGKKLTDPGVHYTPSEPEQSVQGRQRAVLYMRMTDDDDATAFGATMSASFAYGPDPDGRCVTFTSCEKAEKDVYPSLPPEDVYAGRKNVEAFYSDRGLQVVWQDVILHPVCLVLKRDGTLKPAAFTDLNQEFLTEYPQEAVIINDPKSYRWLFDGESR